jgi:predicted dehydrogenase
MNKSMPALITRRRFLKKSSLLATGIAAMGSAGTLRAQPGANSKIRIAIIGCNGRGMAHIASYLALPNAEIAAICDVDSRAVAKGIAAAAKGGQNPKGITDFRKALDDPGIDAVSIAVPDHWHTPAAMLACAAGKHVYVEKPGSHNGHESELIVSAARKHKRVVQMGNQRRSWPWIIESINALHAGELGKVVFARCWYTNHRLSIGHGKTVPPPEWLDYSLWEGPAPERPYHDNVIHYNWHWFWNWGTGELGNNGVHSLDLARWGLEVDVPRRITCGGNRYHYHDDWETPDVYVASFDFGDKGIAWEGQSCDPRGFEGTGFGVNFYGEKGCMNIGSSSSKIYDLNNKLVREIHAQQDAITGFDSLHFSNFLETIRGNAHLNSAIEDGQKSTLLCHLGNIAWRTGHTVNYDSATGGIVGDADAVALWKREYRPGWEPVV